MSDWDARREWVRLQLGQAWTQAQLTARGAWRSKTMWTSALMAGIGEMEIRTGVLVRNLGQHTADRVLFVCAIAMAVLRVVTRTSLCEKVPGTGPAPPAALQKAS